MPPRAPLLAALLSGLLACRPATVDDTAGSTAGDEVHDALIQEGADAPVNPPICLSEVSRYEGGELLVYDLAWSPDGRHLLTGSLNLLRLYGVDPGGGLTLLDTVHSPDRFNSIQWSPDGAIAFAPTGTHLMMFTVEDGALEVVSRGGRHPEALQRVALSPDGGRLLSCDVVGVTRLYQVSSSPPSVSTLDAVEAHERCTRVAWSPDGAMALSTGHDGNFVLYRVGEGGLEVADKLQVEEETGEAVFGRDVREAVGGSFGELNQLWYLTVEPEAGRLSIAQTIEGHASGIGALEWSHGGEYLLSGSHDHTLHILERRADGRGLQGVSDHPDDGAGVHSARWSPDDTRIARTGSDRDLLMVLDVVPCGR